MLAYSRLREIQKKEMESLELVKMEKDFYAQLAQFIESKKATALKNQSFAEMRELENIKKVAKSIIAKRREKLLMISALSVETPEGLAECEQEFLAQLKSTVEKSFGPLEALFEEPRNGIAGTKVKIVKTIDAYKGFDNKIYGPFMEGEEIALPEEEAEWLLKSKMAEHVH